MRMSVLAAVAIGITAAPAHADWQYAKWGMTASELVAASKGKARLVTDTGYPLKFGRRVAEAMAIIDGKNFKVAFYATGGPIYVGATTARVDAPYKITSIRFELADNCNGLLDYLKGKYHRPYLADYGEHRFAEGEDEVWYSSGFSRCSFRRFKKGQF